MPVQKAPVEALLFYLNLICIQAVVNLAQVNLDASPFHSTEWVTNTPKIHLGQCKATYFLRLSLPLRKKSWRHKRGRVFLCRLRWIYDSILKRGICHASTFSNKRKNNTRGQ